MSDIVSVFSGAVKPFPIAEVEWNSVLDNIKSDKYQIAVENIRRVKAEQGEPAARELKKKLPAISFCANFSKNRDHKNVLSATGFIIPDLDHLENVDEIFNLLSQDEHIWFIFRSPGGNGLKCAVRSEGIKTDEDIKKLYAACERYFASVYGLKLDPSCKDIARLTFVSYDPQLFKNPNPKYFNIQKWLPVKNEPSVFNPPDFGSNGWKAKFGIKRLEECCRKIKESGEGDQHPTRLKQARTVGGWIASGFIDELAALAYLENAVISSGAKRIQEAMKTIKDGIAYGKKSPLQPLERTSPVKRDDIQYYCDVNEVFGYDDNDDKRDNDDIGDYQGQHDDKVMTPMMTLQNDDDGKRYPSGPHNLAGTIKEWVENSAGSFTVDQLDREFCLMSRRDKQNRSNILARMCACACPKIKKTKTIGKYEIIDHTLNTVDLKNVSVDPFDIKLPFDLNRYCLTPKKAIIIVAGSSNAGKTGLILNIAKLNLSQRYKKMYLASEMGGGEILSRLTKFRDVPLNDWCENLHIAERSSDFQSVVEAHNRDGLTLIDYLEEIDGQYNLITSQIRSVYDALGSGVAVIGIQKRTDSDYARGGQGTLEKSRMYVAVDSICVVDDQPICAIKIIKLKSWINRNLNFHELHFRLKHGAIIEPVSEWMVLKPGERERYKTIYESSNPERKKDQMDNWAFTFKTKDGTMVGITEETFHDWEKTYSNLNLYEELDLISNLALQGKSLLKDGKSQWIFQIHGKLALKNEKAGANK